MAAHELQGRPAVEEVLRACANNRLIASGLDSFRVAEGSSVCAGFVASYCAAIHWSIALDSSGGIVKCCAIAFVLGRPRPL